MVDNVPVIKPERVDNKTDNDDAMVSDPFYTPVLFFVFFKWLYCSGIPSWSQAFMEIGHEIIRPHQRILDELYCFRLVRRYVCPSAAVVTLT